MNENDAHRTKCKSSLYETKELNTNENSTQRHVSNDGHVIEMRASQSQRSKLPDLGPRKNSTSD